MQCTKDLAGGGDNASPLGRGVMEEPCPQTLTLECSRKGKPTFGATLMSSPKVVPRFHTWQTSLNNPFAAPFFVAELRIPISRIGGFVRPAAKDFIEAEKRTSGDHQARAAFPPVLVSAV